MSQPDPIVLDIDDTDPVPLEEVPDEQAPPIPVVDLDDDPHDPADVLDGVTHEEA